LTLRVADLAPLGVAAARLIARARLPLGVAAGLALACALLLYHDRDRLWNRDLSALSPVSAAAQSLDAAMRADLGAPDIGNLVVVNADSEQAALRLSEAVGARLDALVNDQVIAGYDSAAPCWSGSSMRRSAFAGAMKRGVSGARGRGSSTGTVAVMRPGCGLNTTMRSARNTASSMLDGHPGKQPVILEHDAGLVRRGRRARTPSEPDRVCLRGACLPGGGCAIGPR